VQERMLRASARFLRFYQESLGPYPFGKLDIVEIPTSIHENSLLAFGVATPGLVLMSSEAYNPYRIAEQLGGITRSGRVLGISRGVNGRLAHEIAHQWFPHQAMPATPRDAWLSESFAEYLSGLAMGEASPDAQQVEGFPEMFAQWRSRAKECRQDGSLEMAALLAGPEARNNYECLVYNRGPLVLHMLRALVGGDRFFAILRKFLERGKSGRVTTEDFRLATEAVVQADMGWFFDQWVRQAGIPDIRLKYAVERRGDRFVLTGRATQVDGPAFKKIHIPFVLNMGDGRSDLRLLFQDKPMTEFSFDLPEKPRKVTVDPAQNNLAVYH